MEHSLPRRDTRGKQEMRDLAVCAFQALEDADLTELVDELHARVFAHGPEALFEIALVDDVWQWSFKPMVELLLRHVQSIAANRFRTAPERQLEIRAAMELAGF